MYLNQGSVLGGIRRELSLVNVVDRKVHKVHGISCLGPSYPGV